MCVLHLLRHKRHQIIYKYSFISYYFYSFSYIAFHIILIVCITYKYLLTLHNHEETLPKMMVILLWRFPTGSLQWSTQSKTITCQTIIFGVQVVNRISLLSHHTAETAGHGSFAICLVKSEIFHLEFIISVSISSCVLYLPTNLSPICSLRKKGWCFLCLLRDQLRIGSSGEGSG